MRTTVELTDQQRARLLELAARRGEKGFSRLVQEAVDHYLAAEEERERDARHRVAIGVLGSLGEKEAEELRRTSVRLRENWEC
jgi:metal-responsive CopG/Arc/MetJ family transcriptional regulator